MFTDYCVFAYCSAFADCCIFVDRCIFVDCCIFADRCLLPFNTQWPCHSIHTNRAIGLICCPLAGIDCAIRKISKSEWIVDYANLEAAILYTVQWDKGGKMSRLSEDKFGDGDMLSIYKDTHGLTLDGFVGKFMSACDIWRGWRILHRSDLSPIGLICCSLASSVAHWFDLSIIDLICCALAPFVAHWSHLSLIVRFRWAKVRCQEGRWGWETLGHPIWRRVQNPSDTTWGWWVGVGIPLTFGQRIRLGSTCHPSNFIGSI